jgi:hypothetical protein
MYDGASAAFSRADAPREATAFDQVMEAEKYLREVESRVSAVVARLVGTVPEQASGQKGTNTLAGSIHRGVLNELASTAQDMRGTMNRICEEIGRLERAIP